jgi:hypothetical protein
MHGENKVKKKQKYVSKHDFDIILQDCIFLPCFHVERFLIYPTFISSEPELLPMNSNFIFTQADIKTDFTVIQFYQLSKFM